MELERSELIKLMEDERNLYTKKVENNKYDQ